MNEIYEKLEQIKQNLNNLEIFNKLEDAINKIRENDELIDKIKKYNETYDESLRLDIYKYNEIEEYKRIENEINILILQINQKLKKIKNSEGCYNACY